MHLRYDGRCRLCGTTYLRGRSRFTSARSAPFGASSARRQRPQQHRHRRRAPWHRHRCAESAPVDLPVATIATADDLRFRAPASAVIAEALRVQADAAPRSAAARFFGRTPLSPESRSWFLGAIGELEVGRVLDRLGDGWLVLHAVPVGTAGSDIDHLVIGPSGVFTINTKYHEGMKVWVGSKRVLVNGQRTDHSAQRDIRSQTRQHVAYASDRTADRSEADRRDRRGTEHHRPRATDRRRRALIDPARAMAPAPTEAPHRRPVEATHAAAL